MPALEAITIHAHDLAALARFWSVALGLPIDPCSATSMAHGLQPGESVLLGHRDQLHVWVSPADLLPEARGRVHLDVRLNDSAEEARLVELGAKPVWEHPHRRWVVYEDPEGNRFCVVPPPR